MAYGELFRHFTIRFSLKKAQHVRLLQLFEDKKLTAGRTKNQMVMDALEMFFDALLAGEGKKLPDEMTPEYFEKRLSEMKEEIRTEVLQEVFRIVLGNAAAGQAAFQQTLPVARSPIVETEPEETGEDEVADISGMPDIMDKIMGWSEDS